MRPSCIGLGFGLPLGEPVVLATVVAGPEVGFEVVVDVGPDVGPPSVGMPKLTSMQYELPTLMPLQSSFTPGFCYHVSLYDTEHMRQ